MAKINRNSRCPCGSGKKDKHCCMPRESEFAASAYRSVLETEPRDPEGCNALGLMALEAGQHDAALALIRRAIKGNPREPAYHCNLALVYKAARRPTEAIASFRAALLLDRNFNAARVNLGVVYAELGKLAEALGQLRHAHSLDPGSAAVQDNVGMVLLTQGHSEQALEWFEKAARAKSDYGLAHANAASALHRMNRLPEAIARYERALPLLPEHAWLHCSLAKALCDFGKVEDAALRYREALNVDPDFAFAHNGLGVVLMELGRKEEAIRSCLAALAIDPDLPEAHFNLHSLMIDSRNMRPSIERLQRYVQLRPRDSDAAIHLAVLLEYAGQTEAAARIFRALPPLAPSSRALVDSWNYIQSKVAQNPPRVIGVVNDAFRVGLDNAMPQGLVLEFGVRFGVSIRQIAELLTQQEVHGFDSFVGLPEARHDEPRGSYSTMGVMPEVPGNVRLYKGWFEATLPEFLRLHPEPVRFLHIDCDLYSSTRTVLKLLAAQVVRGTVLVFDDYLGHEHWREDEFRAFQETVAENGWGYEYLAFSVCTRQVVVRIVHAPTNVAA